MRLTITLPDRLGQALENRAAELEQDAAGYLKSLLFAAAYAPQGVVLALTLPPVAKSDLPLLEAAGVHVD